MKHCPFCGNNHVEPEQFPVTQFVIICSNCGARGPSDLTVIRAWEMWNLRRPEDALLRQRDELAAAARALLPFVEQLPSNRVESEWERAVQNLIAALARLEGE